MMAGLVRSDCYFDSVILSSKNDEQQVDVLRTKFNKFQSARKAKKNKYKVVFCQVFKEIGTASMSRLYIFEPDLIAKCFQTGREADLIAEV